MGLSKKDHLDYLVFNNILKNLVVSKGHIYADSKFIGFFSKTNKLEYFNL